MIFYLYTFIYNSTKKVYCYDADLSNATNSTLEKFKTAKNWQKAKYDSESRKWLGLPDENVSAS
ncbi:hypothetical protein DSM106972_038640 [Dulcicalothrix desertica PCC 7102]|uniref:Uncharacterized protein n=1 Tax=Dulcicalothrix desertica PCC 7102 TaxID=232991 RepID=A0A3S1AMW8_9CYAN|nr:hypothetical protein [Dulcicalothrix desertica]RUT05043.1 hypothetical protein DSM106972_038640 [Dulcicalothrix desertica PCC 7102]TWH62584.1 hypothetical protein CAL7102_00077 [Dulcicalothrix desertica PCC 7102]